MTRPFVYVLTLNWNRCQDTLACLESLMRMGRGGVTPPLPIRILVVDNGSTDGSVEAVAAHFPEVEIIANERNLGFAAGCNVGLRHALAQGADYVFIVNNDTTVDPRALDELLAEAAPPDVGMLTPKIYYHDDPTCIWSVGGGRNRLTLEMTGGHGQGPDVGQWEEVVEREYLAGCALLIKRELLERVGLFDERFFMYYEDMDFCLRARRAGYRLLMVPRARIWHKVAASSGGSDSPLERYNMARSSVLFFRKHVRGLRWLIVGPYRLGSAVKWVIRLALRRRWTSVGAYLRGLGDGWRLASTPQ
jgi:GT2 family glycosyltransferase